MASRFDLAKAKWMSGDPDGTPVMVPDRQERMYYPVIKLIAKSEEWSPSLRPPQMSGTKEELVPLKQSETVLTNLSESEPHPTESPVRAKLILPSASKQNTPRRKVRWYEPVIDMNEFPSLKIFALAFFILLMAILFTAVVTWALTRFVALQSEKAEPQALLIRGTVRLLLNRNISKRKTVFSTMAKRSSGDNQCRRSYASCDKRWYQHIENEMQFSCDTRTWAIRNDLLQQKITKYLMNNSTLCLWHDCLKFSICCWDSPARGGIASFAYSMQINPKSVQPRNLEVDAFDAIGYKVASLLAHSNIYHVVESSMFPGSNSRGIVEEVEACTQQVGFAHEMTCEWVERCSKKTIV